MRISKISEFFKTKFTKSYLEFRDFFLDNGGMKEKSDGKKINLKKLVPFAGIIVLIAICAFNLLSRKEAVIAFYGINEEQAKGIQKSIDKINEKANLSYKYVFYDADKKLSSQIPLSNKPKIIFTTSGFAVDSAVEKADKKAGLEVSLIAPMTSSVKGGIKTNTAKDKIAALPLLVSHLEIDVDSLAFNNAKISLNSWADLESFMQKQSKKTKNPIAFAGKDPNTVLDMAGAFAESLDGEESYKMARDIIAANQKQFDAIKTAKALCDEPNSPLATTVKMLGEWYKKGCIHPGTFSFTINDVEAFAESKVSTVLFMTLDEHRNMKHSTISAFSSSYFLSERGGNERVFTGRLIYGVPLTASEDFSALLSELASVAAQEDLSRQTGLAPALAQCRTPDKQASDVRRWIAATKTPLAGLSREVYLTKEQKTALAAEIAARIRTGK